MSSLLFKIRYVHYFQEVQKNKMEVIPSKPLSVKAIMITGTQRIKISRIKNFFSGLKVIGAGDGSDFRVTIMSK